MNRPPVFEDGEGDPVEPGSEPGALDDVAYLCYLFVLEQRQPITHADDPGNPLDACGNEIFGFGPDQRAVVGKDLGAYLRPTGVPVVRTRWLTSPRATVITTRSSMLSIRTGT